MYLVCIKKSTKRPHEMRLKEYVRQYDGTDTFWAPRRDKSPHQYQSDKTTTESSRENCSCS